MKNTLLALIALIAVIIVPYCIGLVYGLEDGVNPVICWFRGSLVILGLVVLSIGFTKMFIYLLEEI